MQEIEISQWRYELQYDSNFLPCLGLSSKSHREHIFPVPLSIRNAKCCQILQRLFVVFLKACMCSLRPHYSSEIKGVKPFDKYILYASMYKGL